MNIERIAPAVTFGSFLIVIVGIVFITLVPDAFQKVPQTLSSVGAGIMMIAGNLMSVGGLASFVLLFMKSGREAPPRVKVMLVLAALLPALLFLGAFIMVVREFSGPGQGH